MEQGMTALEDPNLRETYLSPSQSEVDRIMRIKHTEQLKAHEERYGKLGELMTEEEKARMRASLSRRSEPTKKPAPKKQTPPAKKVNNQ